MTTNPHDAAVPLDHVPTLEEIVRAVRPEPLRSVEDLMARDIVDSDDEVDDFNAWYREQRQASVG